jgi:hypothetical protein
MMATGIRLPADFHGSVRLDFGQIGVTVMPSKDKGQPMMRKPIYDGLLSWDGWGGEFRLVAGQCQLWIYDLTANADTSLTLLTPIVVVVSDLPENYGKPGVMTVRSCAAQIASKVASRFSIKPQRLLYVEYYPARRYGVNGEHHIGEKFDRVRFQWHNQRATNPRWEGLTEPLKEVVAQLIKGENTP